MLNISFLLILHFCLLIITILHLLSYISVNESIKNVCISLGKVELNTFLRYIVFISPYSCAKKA